MKVALIRNVRESRGLSMLLYADRLRDALVRHCDILDVRLEPDFAYQLTGVTGLRIQDYVGRFWSFPQQLRGLQADIFHIVDHANAHLLRVLDPARTVVTCHDLMLLKLAIGEIPWYGPKPWIASIAFRWSVGHLPHAGAVLCDSESTKGDVVRLISCAPERLHVVHPGLHETFRQIFDRSTRAEARMHFGFTWPVTILHVGNHSFYKNLEGIIETLVFLPAEWRDSVHLVKIGQDFTQVQWDIIRRRGLSECISWANLASRIWCFSIM